MSIAQPKNAIDEHLRKLFAMNCYHGLRSRAHVEEDSLKEKGDFLFRMVKGRKNEIVLSICLSKEPERKFTHLPITYNPATRRYELQVLFGIGRGSGKIKASNRSTMETDATTIGGGNQKAAVDKKALTFQSLADLVKCYRDHPLQGGVRLKTPVKRPRWLISITSLKYDPKDILGTGNFCQVVKGRLRGKPDKIVGIKMLHEEENDVQPRSDIEKDEGRDSMFRESQIMAKCTSDYVVRVHGVQCDVSPVMIIMEYCAGGSLDIHLQREKEDIAVTERLIYCYEAARGMKYLHHHKFIHRDLAARNCLIASNGVVKISDFGLSRSSERTEEDIIIKNGPLRWMAPETLSHRPEFSTKSDSWSYGILCYEIYNEGIKPWADETDMKKLCRAIKDGQKPTLPDKTPKEMRRLIHQCWSLTPSERPTFKEIVKVIAGMAVGMKFPKPADCAVNRIEGVNREDIADLSADENEKSTLISSDAKLGTSEESRESKGSKDSRDSRDSCEDATRGIRMTKKQKQHNRSSK